MLDLNLALIKTGLGISLERFAKLREIVQTKAKKVGLGKKMLKTNQMRKKFDNLVEKIRKRVKKYIKNNKVT